MLEIYNSLSKKKEVFKPIDEKNIRMYVCGMTVYDYCHVGHARALIVFDIVYRHLISIYGKEAVTYVRNHTDIDDRIIKRANENGEPFNHLTERFIKALDEDADALGILRPNIEPRATEYIEQIINITQTLVDKGFAYPAANGDVYYSVKKFAEYGKLSGRNLEDERAGARVEIGEEKEDPMDFVLWKASKPDEPKWDSPWGEGRPGWHIECSAMCSHNLGDHFDIHGGGADLKFPHHENEIAQSEAASGVNLANYWIHNGHVMVDEDKMSKSLGNFFTIRDVLALYPAEVIRYFVLMSHYRSPLNYSDENLNHAKAALTRLYTALRDAQISDVAPSDYSKRFDEAMNDDFNTAEGLAVLFDLAKAVNRAKDESDSSTANQLASELKALGLRLGILQNDPGTFLRGESKEGDMSDAEVDALIQERLTARAEKNWARADEIRDQLKAANIILEDGKDGTSWKRG
ncbi:MAG: cysteine--tRNA ligase [Gammaproteobacteria bacterium]|nr:cysteine--tRNA ligase [Gammaproteobacteria bacterium]MDH5692438.1 cysteine--tRNA ligase [Gammaproteobacteria bacterium]